jgi:hypothetical protein
MPEQFQAGGRVLGVGVGVVEKEGERLRFDALAKHDIPLILIMAGTDDEQRRATEFLTAGHVDGVLLVSAHATRKVIIAAGVPAIACGVPLGFEKKMGYVAADDYEGARDVLRYFPDKGRNRMDPYNFEFLGLSGEVAERDLESALTSRITETLRELGPGFSFVGGQVHFYVDGDDFYVDLLFFHIEQSRYVVIELKTGKFQPEYAGKLNFYVALVDDVLRREHHNETIGILICGTKNDRSVRYSLGRSTSPIAVAAYTYDKLPPAEQHSLPDEGHIVAALEWAEPDANEEASSGQA